MWLSHNLHDITQLKMITYHLSRNDKPFKYKIYLYRMQTLSPKDQKNILSLVIVQIFIKKDYNFKSNSLVFIVNSTKNLLYTSVFNLFKNFCLNRLANLVLYLLSVIILYFMQKFFFISLRLVVKKNKLYWNPHTTRDDTTLYRIQRGFFLDPKWFSKNFQVVGRHKKFIYFCPYHGILTKIFNLVEGNGLGKCFYIHIWPHFNQNVPFSWKNRQDKRLGD